MHELSIARSIVELVEEQGNFPWISGRILRSWRDLGRVCASGGP